MKKIYILLLSSVLLGIFLVLPKNNFLTSNTINSLYGTTTCSSIKHGDITWTFSSAVKCGEFANGEPWVVGPVTVTSISPAPTVIQCNRQEPSSNQGTFATRDCDINGSMINPVPGGPRQGFSQYVESASQYITDGARYDRNKNAALRLPLVLSVNDVLVSSKHGGFPSSGTNDKRNVVRYNFLESASALTVLPSIPPEGSFRPSIYGTDRTVRWNINQINWSLLKNLEPTAATPPLSDMQQDMPNLPWLEWCSDWDCFYIQPVDNTADLGNEYGRATSEKFGRVGLWLNTDQPLETKKPIAIQMIQNGLDIYEFLKYPGTLFLEDGGHKSGRKLPLVIAAAMLNDGNQTLEDKASNPTLFQEDRQTWFVTQADVGRAINPSYPGYPTPTTYQQGDVGMAEWGIRHSREPYEDNRNWSTGYRSVVWPAMTGSVLTAELMGLKSLWNHPAIFAYTERFFSIGGAGEDFVMQMYIKHKLGGTPPGNSSTSNSVTPLPFSVGNKITVQSSTVNIRALPGLQGFLRGTQSQGLSGIILDGPKQADNITWWYVDYETGVDGWAGQDTHSVTATNVAQPGDQYTLTSNDTNGTITGNLGTYRNGTIAFLTATPNDGYQLTGWTGCTTSNSTVCEVIMNDNKTVTAQFELIPVARVCKPW